MDLGVVCCCGRLLFWSLYTFGAHEQLAVGLFVCLSVTGLILPVVICLSERVSHACALKYKRLNRETVNGSLNQL